MLVRTRKLALKVGVKRQCLVGLQAKSGIVDLLCEAEHPLGERPRRAKLAARKVEKPETVERREERTGLAEPHTQLARPGIRTLYLRRRIPAHCHARDPQCHLELRLAGSALRGARQTPEQLQSGGVLRHRDTMRVVAHREPPGLGVILDCASDVAGAREKHSELRRDWFGVSTVGSCLARPDPREPRWRTRR